MSSQALISLAVLKVNWDELGHDYVQNFVPFVAEAVRCLPNDAVSVVDVQSFFRDRFGLAVPQGALNILLSRARHLGYVRKEHGVYIRNNSKLPVDFCAKSDDAARHLRALLSRFIDFLKQKYNVDWTAEQAEAALIAHLRAAAVPLAVSTSEVAVPEPLTQPPNAAFLTSAFILYLNREDPEGFTLFETVAKGYMLAAALYLPDISKTQQKFRDLTVFVDTQLLLRALGLEGEASKIAATELLSMLYSMNVSLACFDITFDEANRILDAAQAALRDPAHGAQQSTFPVYQHLLDIGSRASDVELMIAGLERNLRRLNIRVRQTPPHSPELGINERLLAEIVQAAMPTQRAEAQRHDLDCLTAIHRLRKGKTTTDIEVCRFIFMTSNGALAHAGVDFIKREVERVAVPLCITDHALATIAWVKNPGFSEDFATHRIIADSYAALNPSKELWNKYSAEIARLQKLGDLSSEDYQLLRFSTVARNALLDATLGSPDAFTSGTVAEILEVARANARRAVEHQLAQEQEARAGAEAQTEAVRQKHLRARARQVARLETIGRVIGRGAGWIAYLAVLLVVAAGNVYALAADRVSQWPVQAQVITRMVLGAAAVATIWSIAEGGTIRSFARAVEVSTSRWIVQHIARVISLDLREEI